jgi:hypothetical protein
MSMGRRAPRRQRRRAGGEGIADRLPAEPDPGIVDRDVPTETPERRRIVEVPNSYGVYVEKMTASLTSNPATT